MIQLLLCHPTHSSSGNVNSSLDGNEQDIAVAPSPAPPAIGKHAKEALDTLFRYPHTRTCRCTKSHHNHSPKHRPSMTHVPAQPIHIYAFLHTWTRLHAQEGKTATPGNCDSTGEIGEGEQ